MIWTKEKKMANDIKELEERLRAGMSPTAVADGSKKLLIDQLYDSFGADDLVKIKNFTNKPTGWVYADRKETKVEQVNEFTRRVYQGGQKVRTLEAGKIIVVPGWEAFVGLQAFFAQYIQDEYPGELAVRMNSPEEQKKFIDKAFVGVYDPNEPETKEKDVKVEVEKDLGLVDEKPKAK